MNVTNQTVFTNSVLKDKPAWFLSPKPVCLHINQYLYLLFFWSTFRHFSLFGCKLGVFSIIQHLFTPYFSQFSYWMLFIVGKIITSRIEALSVNSITSLSIPIPSPPVGGMPYSRDVTKSSSIIFASSSPASRNFI